MDLGLELPVTLVERMMHLVHVPRIDLLDGLRIVDLVIRAPGNAMIVIVNVHMGRLPEYGNFRLHVLVGCRRNKAL